LTRDGGRARAVGRALIGLLPGLALSLLVAGAAVVLGRLEADLFGRAWIEPLVLAILLGVAVRMVWKPGPRWVPGVAFCAGPLLEAGVALLGATVSAQAIAAAGLPLLLAVVVLVFGALAGGYFIGRAVGLTPRLSLLIAAGNAVCGNSAIVAVAPVIKAEAKDVAAAIGFTAVLGVAVVLLLPLAGAALNLRPETYGVVAGLTVYAVPQVLAAAAPMGPVAVQVGALVKLMRVLMLGPVCVVMGLIAPRLTDKAAVWPRPKLPLSKLVPWFIVAFLALMGARSLGWISADVAARIGPIVTALTVTAMAALGLGVDPRALFRAGPRVAAAASLSILALAATAIVLALLLT
jgi:uncharacterized integral membrane protein (TIGR00698 family)